MHLFHDCGSVPRMNRRELVLSTLAAGGQQTTLTPVQVQKIFFLLDRQAAHLIGGAKFNFQPYDYGPFDNAVYEQLERLHLEGIAQIDMAGRHKSFALTPAGYAEGSALLASLAIPTQDYIRAVVTWVRSLRFDQLVAAIYRSYPEMKVNSIFNQ
jgi:hypothetical protein